MHQLFNTATKRWLWFLVVGTILALAATSYLHAIGVLLFIGSLCVLGIDVLKNWHVPKKPPAAPAARERVDVQLAPLARKSPLTNTVDWKKR